MTGVFSCSDDAVL